ncbi:putative inorganic phosphate cotransporter isoform X1 [Drosophila albomicans]|uniref:Inorganic phosphate cotransporter isoform X1 n=1 Tax=Drosophila albomicans TaxID=7291 RepID=A0A9C6ST38_DROAB|nr:putative inorganic phosphate cotransporter isoform X1 [Drosophila albomicans]
MDNRPEWGKGCSRGCLLPQRVVVAIMSFLAIICAYTHRVSISHVITKLVVPINRTNDEVDHEDVCPVDEDTSTETPLNKGDYDWSEQMQGYILGSFYLGYLISQLPGGVLADKYGAKWVLSACLLLSGLCTMCLPLAIHVGEEWGLIVMRVFTGLAQGPLFPGLTALLSSWVPSHERGRLCAFAFSGVTIGTVVSNLSSGLMLHYYHWSVTFVVFGLTGPVWFIIFFFLCTSRPDQHPCIKPEELSYLTEALGERSQGKSPLPWKELLLSVPLLALVISQIGHDWGYYVMITCLPKYIANVIRFSIRSNGFVTALPFLAMFICTNLAGLLADYIIKSGKMSITNERKLYTFISAFGPGAFTVLASYAGCNKILVIGLFTFAMFLMGFYYSGQKLTPMDMSPSYAGTLMAICNGLGSLAGLASPPVVGYLTPNATMNEWRVVFWLGFVIFIISAIVFAVIGTAEVQPYDPAYTGEKKKG